ncbi:MAG: GTP-binding protein [Eubacteriales bacterium]|nr:GTP-binding protein [Eubacteriales bacterium]
MTEIIIVAGFLGAGKTTFIEQLIDAAPENRLLSLIENDFGEVNTDAVLMRNKNIRITELTSGCICCSLTGDFAAAVEDLRRTYAPDLILIEPSGIAKPEQIKIMLRQLSFPCETHIVTVLDAGNAVKHYENFGTLFDAQIEHADIVHISKRDRWPERVAAAIKTVQSVVPERQIHTDDVPSLARMLCPSIYADAHANLKMNGADETDAHHLHVTHEACNHEAHAHRHHHDGHGDDCHCGHDAHHHEHSHDSHCGHDAHHHEHDAHHHTPVDGNFDTLTLYVDMPLARTAVDALLKCLTAQPGVLRIKGFLPTDSGSIAVQYTDGDLRLTPCREDVGFLTVIGHQMDVTKIRESWKHYA